MRRLLLLIPVLFFLANCVVSTAILAQTKDNVENLVEVTEYVDDFYETIIRSETEIWYGIGENRNGDKVSGQLLKIDGVIYFSILFSPGLNLGCAVEQESTMEIKLTNSAIVKFTYISDTKCDNFGNLVFIPVSLDKFINEWDELINEWVKEEQIIRQEMNNTLLEEHMVAKMDLLKKYDWEIIRITGSEGYTDFKPNYSLGKGMWGLDSDSLKNKLKKPKLYFQHYYHQTGYGDGAWAVSDNKLQKIQSPEQFFRQHLIAIDQK